LIHFALVGSQFQVTRLAYRIAFVEPTVRMFRVRAALILLSVSAALPLSAAPAFAGAKGDPTQECDGSTVEIVECIKTKTAQSDRRLNIAFEKALKAANPQQHDQLRTAQRLWVQYRDANCLYVGMGEGTISRISAAECLFNMTEERAKELETLSDQ
jgi:uncharacterized protein YecT (DUF1311 family)